MPAFWLSDDSKLFIIERFDIVTTTVYLPRDKLALRMNRSKAWPGAKALAEFGKACRLVDHPQRIVERIATAALASRPREDTEVWRNMRREIEKGCFSAGV